MVLLLCNALCCRFLYACKCVCGGGGGGGVNVCAYGGGAPELMVVLL